MAILRVNVRPACKLRLYNHPQRRGATEELKKSADSADYPHKSEGKFSNTASDVALISKLKRKPNINASSPIGLINEQREEASPVAPNNVQPQIESTWQQIVWHLMPDTPVGRALVSATQRLESRDIDTPQLDSQIILAHVLDVERSWLFGHHEYKLSESEAERFTELIVRRMNYEPVAYLIGRKEFYGLEFIVDERVLIPRPETELLVDAVLGHIDMRSDFLPVGQQLSVIDVGTGCGAIALAVADNAPEVRVYATDISRDALEIARTNVRLLDKRCQVSLLSGDLLSPLNHKIDMEKVDVIVANLPYINSSDYKGLAPDVRDYEPQVALEAGPKGLDSISRLLEQAPQYLNPNGIMFLEIGHDQAELVISMTEQLIPQARLVSLRQDYSGLDRLVTIEL